MWRERPGPLLARRTRTIRMCSFDARSKGQPRLLPLRRAIRSQKALALDKARLDRAEGWLGGIYCAQLGSPQLPLSNEGALAVAVPAERIRTQQY
jgi:hypothetical protein